MVVVVLWGGGVSGRPALYSVCGDALPFRSDPLGLSSGPCPSPALQQQQLQAQHLSHAAHGPPVQLPPHPSGLQPPGLPTVTGAGPGLLALGALGSQAHLPVKDEKNHHDLEHRGRGRLSVCLSVCLSHITYFKKKRASCVLKSRRGVRFPMA